MNYLRVYTIAKHLIEAVKKGSDQQADIMKRLEAAVNQCELDKEEKEQND